MPVTGVAARMLSVEPRQHSAGVIYYTYLLFSLLLHAATNVIGRLLMKCRISPAWTDNRFYVN